MWRKKMLRPLVWCALVLFTAQVQAQVPAAQTGDPLPSGESLTLSRGDVIHIRVIDAPELEQTAQLDEGHILLPLGGTVDLNGLSASQASVAVENALKQGRIMLDPHVSITVETYATQFVTVVGEVKKPGTYYIATQRTVLDVLALAGGLSDAADRHVVVERHDTGEKIPYFVSNDATLALTANIQVLPGDRILVAKQHLIYMLGDFGRPGAYPAATNDSKLTLLQAVAFAGGTPPTAVPSHARLVRKKPDGTYESRNIQLSSMQKGHKPDFLLQPDDIVYVPYSYLRNIGVNLSGLLAAATSSAIYIH
jgi:polysaccharide export outer membrane protein